MISDYEKPFIFDQMPSSTRVFMSEYAASISPLSAAAFMDVSGLNFTWRMNLPVPCNKRDGSGRVAP